MGVKEVLDRENIAYGEGVTFPAFVESLSSCQTADFHNPVLAINMYRYCGLDVIDEYGSRGDLSVDALRSFVESYDKLFPDIYNGRYRDYVVSNSAYDNSQCGALLAGDELFFNPKPDYPDRCFLVYLDGILSAITEAGGTPVVTHMPTMTGQGVAGALGWSFAVSATTEAPEAALRFLKYALSFEAQCEDTRTRGIPVNNAYMEAVKAWYYGRAINFPEGNSMSNFQFYIDPVDRSILDAYFDILSAVYIPRYISNNAVRYIQNVIVDVSKDKMTVSAAIEKEQFALEEYLKQ